MNPLLAGYASRGARALIVLHEHELRALLGVWREAKQAGITLPATSDPAYASLDSLLLHVFRAARGYMTWLCASLGLPDPGIDEPPAVDGIGDSADAYLEHVLERWRGPLREVTDERFEEVHTSRWGAPYCLDSMMEHAVVHPMRHAFQLRELIETQRR